MGKTVPSPGRRRFVCGAVAGVLAAPIAGLLGTGNAIAAEMPKLDPNNGQAKALNYVHDASAASSHAAFQDGSNCANCMHWTGGDSEWGGCNIFPGNAVNRNGWCSAWVKGS